MVSIVREGTPLSWLLRVAQLTALRSTRGGLRSLDPRPSIVMNNKLATKSFKQMQHDCC